MDKREGLRVIVADFFETTPDRIDDGFRLAGPRMQGSVARYALDAALRRKLGLSSRAAYTATTFGELARGLFGAGEGSSPVPPTEAAPTSAGSASAASRPAPLSSPSTRRLAHEMGVDLRAVQPTGARGRVSREDVVKAAATLGATTELAGGVALPGMLACGIDIEMVSNMPSTPDHWRSDFYSMSFTPAEIAYCLLQERPAMHFAGRWCAKEALKKCDNSLLHEPMGNLELAHDASGEVFFRHRAGGAVRRLPFAVSISHTPTTAVAVVARVAAETASFAATSGAPVASAGSGASVPAAPATTPRPVQGRLAALPRLLLARLLR
jgi:phosphopantetheinyl transferase (holo-ACP synthase)